MLEILENDKYKKHLENSRNWKKQNLDRVKKYRKQYYVKNKKRTSLYNKIWAEENRERVLVARKRYAIKAKFRYKERILARTRLNTAISGGKIKRLPCQVCNKPNGQGHHYLGYNKKYWYKVIWLCPKHHQEMHNEY